jgi:hypothetical protein
VLPIIEPQFQKRNKLTDPGAVVKDVKMVQFADREFYYLRNAGGISNVDRNGNGFSTGISDFARCDLRAFEIHVRHGDIGSFACKPPLHLRADVIASKATSIRGFASFYQIGS